MSTRLTRYRSEETGPFKRADRNEAHVTVPSNAGVVDYEHSTVVFNMRADVDTVSTPAALRPVQLKVEPHMMVRTSEEKSDRVGVVTSNVFQNHVHGNLSAYEESRLEAEAARALGMRTGYYRQHSGFATGTFDNTVGDAAPDLQYHGSTFPMFQPSVPQALGETRDSSELSTLHEAEIHIPLKYFSGLASSKQAKNQMPLFALGNMTYKLELDNRIKVLEYPATGVWACENATADGNGDLDTVQLTYEFEDNVDLKKLDLGVGVLAKVAWTGGSGGAGNATGTITQIAVSGAGVTTVTVSITGLANNQTLTGVTIGYADAPTAPEYEILDIYIEAHRLQLTPKQMDRVQQMVKSLVINYQDYVVKSQQLVAGPVYEQTLLVPPSSRGVFVLTPQNISSADDAKNLYSGWDYVENYRIQVTDPKGVLRDATSQPIPTLYAAGRFGTTANYLDIWNNRGLHNIRLKEFFYNVNRELKRYEQYGDAANPNTGSPVEFQSLQNRAIYPQMLIPEAQNQPMTLILNTDGVNNMTQKTVLFVFLRERQLSFRNGQLELR